MISSGHEPTPNVEVAAVASRLRAMDPTDEATRDLLLDMLPEKVVITHRPPEVIDGEVDGAFIRDGLKIRFRGLAHAVTDYHYRVERIEAFGDEVHLTWRWNAVMPDGQTLDYAHRIALVIQDGAVVEFISVKESGPEQRTLMELACAEGEKALGIEVVLPDRS